MADLVLLRLLAVAGVLLAGAGVASLARSHGRDPARAVLLGVGSPLVLTALVGGAHNDALMAGLLVAGLAVARRVGPVPGIVLCSLAAGVKAPAILGVAFIGWNWPGPGAGWRSRIAHGALAGAVAGGTLAIVSTATGLGWGWLRTLGAADRVSTGVTPVDATAKIVRGLGLALHLQLSFAGTRTRWPRWPWWPRAPSGVGCSSAHRRWAPNWPAVWPCWPWPCAVLSCGPGI